MPQLSLHAPLFDITLYEDEGLMLSVDWGWSFGRSTTPLLTDAKRQLDLYFDGDHIMFDLPIGYPSWSADLALALRAVSDIPYGETLAYSDLSETTGLPEDDLESLLTDNPLPILVPCHRVIRTKKDGIPFDLGPYCGGEDIDVQRELLILEGAHPPY